MLLRKGRKEYEFLVVTHRIECSPWNDFVGVFKNYEDFQQNISSRLLKAGNLTVWQMNVGLEDMKKRGTLLAGPSVTQEDVFIQFVGIIASIAMD